MINLFNRNATNSSLSRVVFITGMILAITLVSWGATGRSGNYVPKAQAASVDYFLKIEGIDGESQDSQHPSAIQIESWSWGESNAGISHGSGGGAGKVSFQDFSFTSSVSKATPKLMLAAANGKRFPRATLTVRKAGGDQQDYYKVTLLNVMVSSYGNSGSGTNIPTDQFSLNFTKIEFEYKTQKADGTLDAPIKASWDLKTNKGS